MQQTSANINHTDRHLDGSNIFDTEIGTKSIGRFKYQDGEVHLLQNQRKPTDFFFTPFPYIESSLTDCNLNEFSGYNELSLFVSLYTPNLVSAIERHLKQHQNICETQHCDVSMLPMNSIRLHQKGLRTNDTRNKYTLDSEWQSNTPLLQTIEFIIYTSSMDTCEKVKSWMTTRCRLTNFEIQYSLHAQQTVARQLEISTEHVTSTTMYNSIRSQFPSDQQDSVALSGHDFKDLLTETTDRITMNLRIQEGYEGLQDPIAIDKMLERQLSYKTVQLKDVNDHLWDSLYWKPELTRPDRLSKILNKIIKQDSGNSNKFRFDHQQIDEGTKHGLKIHEKQKLDDIKKQLIMESRNLRNSTSIDSHVHVGSHVDGTAEGKATPNVSISVDGHVEFLTINNTNNGNKFVLHNIKETGMENSTNNEKTNSSINIIQRQDIEKLVRYLSEHVELEGDIIKPKPIDVKLVKFGSLKSNTKLFSNSVLVKTRTHIHALPLRCPLQSRNVSMTGNWVSTKLDQLSGAMNNFTEIITKLNSSIRVNVDRLTENLQDFKRTTSLTNNAKDIQNTALIQSFESRMTYKWNETSSKLENSMKSAINQVESRLNQKITDIKTSTDNSNNAQTKQLIGKLVRNALFYEQDAIKYISVKELNPLKVVVTMASGMWIEGMVCDDNFNSSAAIVTCRMWGSSNPGDAAYVSAQPMSETNTCSVGLGDTTLDQMKCEYVLDDLSCSSSATNLLYCGRRDKFKNDCGDKEHVEVICP